MLIPPSNVVPPLLVPLLLDRRQVPAELAGLLVVAGHLEVVLHTVLLRGRESASLARASVAHRVLLASSIP
mgnify:CR=1 FL=1